MTKRSIAAKGGKYLGKHKKDLMETAERQTPDKCPHCGFHKAKIVGRKAVCRGCKQVVWRKSTSPKRDNLLLKPEKESLTESGVEVAEEVSDALPKSKSAVRVVLDKVKAFLFNREPRNPPPVV